MLKLGHFTRFPAVYKDREELVKKVILRNIKVTKTDSDTIRITSSTNKYDQEIEIFDKSVHLNSPCKVSCTCQSLIYEFANSLFKEDSLLNPLEFLKSVITRPKVKNVFNIPSGCKHIVALAKSAIKIKTI